MPSRTLTGCFDKDSGKIRIMDECITCVPGLDYWLGCLVADMADPHFGQVSFYDFCEGDTYYGCLDTDGHFKIEVPTKLCGSCSTANTPEKIKITLSGVTLCPKFGDCFLYGYGSRKITILKDINDSYVLDRLGSYSLSCDCIWTYPNGDYFLFQDYDSSDCSGLPTSETMHGPEIQVLRHVDSYQFPIEARGWVNAVEFFNNTSGSPAPPADLPNSGTCLETEVSNAYQASVCSPPGALSGYGGEMAIEEL